jgi:hypothetical protein
MRFNSITAFVGFCVSISKGIFLETKVKRKTFFHVSCDSLITVEAIAQDRVAHTRCGFEATGISLPRLDGCLIKWKRSYAS